MMADSSAKIVLVQTEIKDQLSTGLVSKVEIVPFLSEDEKPESFETQDLLDKAAYVIYTSGSTGQPKAVPVTHSNLIHSNVARFHFYQDTPSSFLLLSSFSFDSSVAGIFWTLCSGGKLVLPPQRIEQDVEQLSTLIQKERVSHSLMLPSLYQVILTFAAKEKLQSLVAIIVAGEACSKGLINEHFKKLSPVKLYNEYGPTEASVWCIAHEFIKEDNYNTVPIGKAIPNAKTYILDQFMQPVPLGISGELYIGGIGVTKGYLNRPDLTGEKFLPNPFSKGEQIYKTGDVARYRKDGIIDFLGRSDSQVKIRGHRVELEEIRSIILQQKDVNEAVIYIHEENGNKNIIAYLESKVETVEQFVQKELKTKLPSYMVPSSFVVMESLPKLPNGKVDVNHLPSPSLSTSINYVAPANEIQEQLVTIWQEVLNLKQIGIHDNFFDIGGDSIRSIQIIAKARKIGLQLKPASVLEHQTIAQLSEILMSANSEDTWSSIVALKTSGDKVPLFCIHSGGAHVLFYQGLAKNMTIDRPVYAIQPSGIDGDEDYHNSVVEMATDYISEMKKIQQTGPYHLIGTCFGNAVGLEMMHQL
ncbi:MAG: amino acid adenylation domain-containing protein [Flavobacteriales bacterium]|nr:amino acid adenylation domain-containing protein [Flavobacteriales bacterium]